MSLPIVGTEMEIYGVLGAFISADISASGEITFTVRVTEGNAKVIGARAEAAGGSAVHLSPTIVQVPAVACMSKYLTNSMESEGYLKAEMSQSLHNLQRLLARRMRISA